MSTLQMAPDYIFGRMHTVSRVHCGVLPIHRIRLLAPPPIWPPESTAGTPTIVPRAQDGTARLEVNTPVGCNLFTSTDMWRSSKRMSHCLSIKTRRALRARICQRSAPNNLRCVFHGLLLAIECSRLAISPPCCNGFSDYCGGIFYCRL